MKKLALLGLLLTLLPGCYLYADFWAPLDGDMDGHKNGSKSGTSSHEVFLGIIALGDSSTDMAAKNGKISAMTHADVHIKSILGIYTKITTRVHGN